MLKQIRAWLDDIPLADPLRREQARLLQVFLLVLIAATTLGAVIPLMTASGTERLVAFSASMVLALLLIGALAVLRRGRFTIAVVLVIISLIAIVVVNIVPTGLEGTRAIFTLLALPVVLAGLLGARRIVLLALVLSVLAVIGVTVLEIATPTLVGYSQETYDPLPTCATFVLVISVLALLVSRFGGALQQALTLALNREQELESLRASLEITVAERTADLQIANSQMQATNTELQRAKAVAETARTAAEEANQFKTQFLANMSHELRTPLNAIINFTEFLGEARYGPLTERQQNMQQRVIANGEHLLGLINDILDLAKIEAGRMDLFREPIDLTHMLRGVMATASGLTKDKGLDLELELSDELPTVNIDKTRIRQVLLNLLSNAAKFTEQGSITVRVVPTADGMVQLSVQDSGIGIAKEQQHLVFEEFRQVDGELTREHQGTGLGIPISKRLVEMHGGQLWLESEAGIGSTFFFTIPVHQSVAPAPALHTTPAVDGANQSAPLIVVVDDDPIAQEILQQHLLSSGYALRVVSDSREALPTIEQLQPQLVILDVVMPYKDGWEVLTELRMTPTTAEIPVVMCSIIDEQRLGLTLGANDYLVKPVRSECLLAAIRRWLGPAASVLIIDDESESRQILRAILETAQYEVREADSGRSGLAAVQADAPDLIVLDLMMPELDGFQVLTHLRSSPEHAALPVIVVTAKDLTAHEQTWLRERAQIALQKFQLAPSEFIALLDQLICKEPIH